MKLQKPTEIDASFLYVCPNTKCGIKHWLFLREVQVKNFKVVCDCGTIFKPKTIKNIKICYVQKTKKKFSIETNIPNVPKKQTKTINSVPLDVVESCVKILDGYGFNRSESIKLVTKAYSSTDDKSIVNIIKIALSSLEIQNV